MSRIVQSALPPRLGPSFRWLLASSWTTNLGDGIAIAAGPLLVAAQTSDAFLVAMAALLQWLPRLLFGLVAGVLSDRLDRRGLIMAMNALRALILVVLATTILTGTISIAIALAALFLLGTAEVFADNSASTLLPMLVHRDDLAVANARLQAGFITINQLAAPPIGAALFATGMAIPFLGQAVAVCAGVLLVRRIALPVHGRERGPVRDVGRDVVAGIRWVGHHAAVRTLVLTIFIVNIT